MIGAAVLALILQGCGTTGNKPTPAKPYTGKLPALDSVQFVTPKTGFVGGKGIVLETENGGRSWTRIYSGSASITEVDFVSSTAGWLLTSKGEVFTRVQGGGWQKVALPGQAAWVRLSKSGGGQLLTVQGALYRKKSTGGAWKAENLRGVLGASFSYDNAGWAVTGGTNGAKPQIWRTSDGGVTWRSEFSPTVGEPEGGWSPAVQSAGSAVAVLLKAMSGAMEHQPFVVFANAGAGQGWREVLAAPPFAPQGFYPAPAAIPSGLQAGPFALSGDSAFFLTWAPATPNDVLTLTMTRNGGKSWTNLPISGVGQAQIPNFFSTLQLAAASPSTVWLVGASGGQGRMLESTDGGARWKVVAP